MTDGHALKDGCSVNDLVAAAEAQVLRVGLRLAAIIERLEAGDMAAAGEVPAVVATLDKALGAVFSERAKRDRNGGGASREGNEFDFAAARAEIERRLARLRDVGGSGTATGGAE